MLNGVCYFYAKEGSKSLQLSLRRVAETVVDNGVRAPRTFGALAAMASLALVAFTLDSKD